MISLKRPVVDVQNRLADTSNRKQAIEVLSIAERRAELHSATISRSTDRITSRCRPHIRRANV
jgi:hypothetical protein